MILDVGLCFIENTNTPAIAYVDDTATITYDTTTVNLRNRLFRQCLAVQDKIHPWLRAHLLKN